MTQKVAQLTWTPSCLLTPRPDPIIGKGWSSQATIFIYMTTGGGTNLPPNRTRHQTEKQNTKTPKTEQKKTEPSKIKRNETRQDRTKRNKTKQEKTN